MLNYILTLVVASALVGLGVFCILTFLPPIAIPMAFGFLFAGIVAWSFLHKPRHIPHPSHARAIAAALTAGCAIFCGLWGYHLAAAITWLGVPIILWPAKQPSDELRP